MGGEGEGGGGEGEGGGFLGGAASWIEKGVNAVGHVTEGMTGIDLANQASGAYKAYQAFAPFKDIVGSPSMGELWKAGGTVAEEGGGFLGGASKFLGPAGQVLAAGTSIADGVMAANDISKMGWDDGKGGGAYHSSEFYNHVGGSALGAAHTVLPFLGPYGKAADLALTGGEAVATYGGKAAGWAFGDGAKFSADSVAGGLVRGTFGDQSAGEKVRQGVGSVFGHGGVANAVGWGADVLTNSALLPMQLGSTVGRGIYNEGAAIVDSIANGKGAVGHALNSAGHWVGNEASQIGHGISNAASSAWNWGSNAVSNIGSGIANTASNVGHGIANTASSIGSGIANTASSIGHGVSNAASSVGNAASSAFHAVTSW